MSEPTDITYRLRQEFRVRDWWPGMDSFDSARGETVPHPLAQEAASEIEALRALVVQAHRDSWSDEGEQMWACRGLMSLSDEQTQVLLRALGRSEP